MKCVDLCKDTIRIKGVHFSYNRSKQDEKNFWETITKIVDFSVMIKFPTEIIVELEKIEKRFIWPSKPKIKNETISSSFKDRGLRNVDINKKIASLQYSWIKRLYDGFFHEWKLIPLKLITNSFGDDLKFHSNLSSNKSCARRFPCFYKNILLNWKHLIYQQIPKPSQAFFHKIYGSASM